MNVEQNWSGGFRERVRRLDVETAREAAQLASDYVVATECICRPSRAYTRSSTDQGNADGLD